MGVQVYLSFQHLKFSLCSLLLTKICCRLQSCIQFEYCTKENVSNTMAMNQNAFVIHTSSALRVQVRNSHVIIIVLEFDKITIVLVIRSSIIAFLFKQIEQYTKSFFSGHYQFILSKSSLLRQTSILHRISFELQPTDSWFASFW